MKTLYDLIGALPDDDAEGLRTAFRKAVKETHPDINAGDPDAPVRFRQIVRAHAILGDPQQRATYDRLLALALRQAGAKSRRRISAIRKYASDAMIVGFLSVMSIGGYILFDRLSNVAVAPARTIEVASRGPVEIAAVITAAPADTKVLDRPRERSAAAAGANAATAPAANASVAGPSGAPAVADAGPAPDLRAKDPNPDVPTAPSGEPGSAAGAGEATAAPVIIPPAASATTPAPDAVAPAAKPDSAPAIAKSEPKSETNSEPNSAEPKSADLNSADLKADVKVDPAPAPPPHDAKSYRERGTFAYRQGDLRRAIADFDLAIQHDPHFAAAYIDRGIVFYRLHQFDRAFADIAQAKRIEKANRARTASRTPRKDG